MTFVGRVKQDERYNDLLIYSDRYTDLINSNMMLDGLHDAVVYTDRVDVHTIRRKILLPQLYACMHVRVPHLGAFHPLRSLFELIGGGRDRGTGAPLEGSEISQAGNRRRRWRRFQGYRRP